MVVVVVVVVVVVLLDQTCLVDSHTECDHYSLCRSGQAAEKLLYI